MLTIVLLTCKRNLPEGERNYAELTLRSTLEYLHSPGHPEISVHIADDSPKDQHKQHVEPLVQTADEYGVSNITVTCSNKSGYGANYNLGMQVAHQRSQYVLPLEDDWELIKDLNVDPILKTLSDGLAGCVRLGYLGYTQSLDGTFFTHANLHWIRLNSFSAEPHVFAGHPRIETVEWARSVGPWQIGLTPGETEWEVSHRSPARKNVVWPISLTKPEGELYVHIGTVRSY